VTRAAETWLVEPLQGFVAESSARLVLVMTSAGQVLAQHGFARSLDIMTAAALGAGIVASAEALARLLRAGAYERVVHEGRESSVLLGAFDTPRGRWIGLVVFGPETTLGLVQLFFGQLVRRVTAAMPADRVPAPVLARDFERELQDSLRALFGR